MQALRNTLYILLQLVMTPLYAFANVGCFWLPPRQRNLMCRSYTLFIWFAKHRAASTTKSFGRENLPDKPFIVLSKHSSTWETLDAGDTLRAGRFRRQEGTAVGAVFGWGFALSLRSPSNRKGGRAGDGANDRAGRERLNERGFTIVVFPTPVSRQVPRANTRPVGCGWRWAAILPILPVAHNAGYCWPRHPWKKFPGQGDVVDIAADPADWTHPD